MMDAATPSTPGTTVLKEPSPAFQLWHPDVVTENALLPFVLIGVYFVGCALSLANYVGYIRFHEDVYGDNLVRAYLSFVVLGITFYLLGSAVMWLWAAKYVSTHKDRRRKIAYGLAIMFLLHDLPLFSIEYNAVLCCGWRHGLQGTVFVYQIALFLMSFVSIWLAYAWRIAGFLEQNYGSGPVLHTGASPIPVYPSIGSIDGQRLLPPPQLETPWLISDGHHHAGYGPTAGVAMDSPSPRSQSGLLRTGASPPEIFPSSSSPMRHERQPSVAESGYSRRQSLASMLTSPLEPQAQRMGSAPSYASPGRHSRQNSFQETESMYSQSMYSGRK